MKVVGHFVMKTNQYPSFSQVENTDCIWLVNRSFLRNLGEYLAGNLEDKMA